MIAVLYLVMVAVMVVFAYRIKQGRETTEMRPSGLKLTEVCMGTEILRESGELAHV